MMKNISGRIAQATAGATGRWLAVGLGLLALLSGCGLQKDIDVDLPAQPAQLVVEAYFENGQFPQLTVTETSPYLADPTPRVPTDVTVVLTKPNGTRDTLLFFPGQNPFTKKLFTHVSPTPLAARPGDTFRLDVTDTQGRHVRGTATVPATVPIVDVEYKFNDKPADQRRAYVTLKFDDPAATADFYRFQVHKDSLTARPEVDYTPDDRLLNGQRFVLGTGYEFKANDTLFVALYHLDKPFYDFLSSVQNARSANGNPFGQPAQVISTVQGGIGVFTILSYERRRVIVR